MKRKSLIVFLAAGSLALASIGGVLIANADSGTGKEGIQERAAEILGVEPSDLKDALAQAHKEAVDAKIEAFIDSAVADGEITESDATEIRDWLADQPELSGLDGRRGKFGLTWLHHGGNSKAGAILDKLVENGLITEDELTAYTGWLDERPERWTSYCRRTIRATGDASSGTDTERADMIAAKTKTGRLPRRLHGVR